jgi:hypothetical protein
MTVVVAILATLWAFPLHAAPPFHFWSQRFGGANSDQGYSVAVDPSGNVYVTGYFEGTANFGGADLVSAGFIDIFVVKYNSAGVHQWSKSFGSYGADIGQDIAVDASGSVYVTGYFTATVDFGGGILGGSGTSIFVAKYNSSGVHQWSKSFGSGIVTQGWGIAVDASGNVFITGYIYGTVDFGGGGLVSAGFVDIFVAKFNSAGVHQWSQRFGSADGDVGYGIAADALGNVFVTGYFSGTVDFGGGGLVSAGGFDIFVAKYNSAGAHQWSKRFGSGGAADEGLGVAVDGSGNVLVTGLFSGTADFGGGGLVSVGGSDDIFVAKYNAGGVHQWSQRFGSTGPDEGLGVAVDASGNVVVTGLFSSIVNFGGGPLGSAGSFDMFVAKYNSNGVHQWSQRSGSGNGDLGYGIAAGTSGDVLVTGYFNGTVDFGGGDLVSAGGSDDVFLARYAPYSALPSIADITDVDNDQGRLVKIRFGRSYFDDAGSLSPIVQYEAYRRDGPAPSASIGSDGAAVKSGGIVRASGWTQVGAVAAHGETSYGIDVPTIGDSTITLGQYYSRFFIRGATSNPVVYFDSPADSGYSVDNLAPSIPSNFVYSAGLVSWDESKASDFDYYTVYGSNTDSFGAATVVNYSVSPSLNVIASPYVFYFVTATDFSGNEGRPASVNTLSGVGGTPKSYVLSVSNYPNPFNPRTTVSYTVPARGLVTVAIYDARGEKVATLVNHEDRTAGAYTVEWTGRANNGEAVTSGVYFARIEQSGSVRSKKMVMLK